MYGKTKGKITTFSEVRHSKLDSKEKEYTQVYGKGQPEASLHGSRGI